MKKAKEKTPTTGEAPAAPTERTGPPRPVGAPRRFKVEDYQAIKLAMQDCTLTEQSMQQTVALAQAAVAHARQLNKDAVARMKRLLDRHSLKDGGYELDDAKCTMQLVE